MTEIRTTSSTGGQKGVKPERFDLIPVGALTSLARHYGAGAEKYTTYGECTCSAANAIDQGTPGTDAAITTTSGSSSGTPTTPSDSGKSATNGTERTRKQAESRRLDTDARSEAERTAPSESRERSMTPTSPSPAASVAHPASTSTTITHAASADAGNASEVVSVTDATSDSATSKDGSSSTKIEHAPGCDSFRVVENGGNQWRKGYEWSKSYAALQRHLTAWWEGEDIDEETGSSHLDAVAWHAFTLRTFIDEHPDFDDRFRNAQSTPPVEENQEPTAH